MLPQSREPPNRPKLHAAKDRTTSVYPSPQGVLPGATVARRGLASKGEAFRKGRAHCARSSARSERPECHPVEDPIANDEGVKQHRCQMREKGREEDQCQDGVRP